MKFIVSYLNIASNQESGIAFALVYPVPAAAAPVVVVVAFCLLMIFYVSLTSLFVVSYEISVTDIMYMSST